MLFRILGILSYCQRLHAPDRPPDGEGHTFAARHHLALTSELGIELKSSPADTAFLYFTLQMGVTALCAAIGDWTLAEIPGGASGLDQFHCDSQALRAPPETTAGGASTFFALVTLYSGALGLAICEDCTSTGGNPARAVLKQLLCELDLDGLLIQVDALPTQKPLVDSFTSRSRSRDR